MSAGAQQRFAEALALHKQGQLPLAEILYREVLRVAPAHAQALFHLGVLYQQGGRIAEALDAFERAAAAGATDPRLFERRGVALHQLGRYDEAIVQYQRALMLDPRAAETEMNFGVALYELRRFEEARARHERALALQPGNVDVQVNLANALLELGEHERALELYRQVAALRPRDPDVQMNLGNVLREMRRFEEALPCYERALALAPANADVHWNHALALLAMGDLVRGGREYEWRLRMPALADTNRQFAAPRWSGKEALAGRTVLLHAEQGLGDTLQFCRYAVVLRDAGAKVLLEVQKPLLPLLRGQPGLGEVIARGTDAGAYDFHCPLMSLPCACRTELGTVPAPVPYVRPDGALVQRWRGEVHALPAPRIGLAWSGNPQHPNDYRRSIPLATLLAALPAGASYWSLQKDLSPEDERLLAADGRIRRFGENAFEHTAAQIASLDAVVCVDTSIGHLAGAMGARTFLLLAHTADWRWPGDGEATPWYPRHTLLRQDRPGDWAPVLHRLAGAITSLD